MYTLENERSTLSRTSDRSRLKGMKESSRMSQRYRVLAQQLTQELGSQAKAAATLGCSKGYFSGIVNGEKNAETTTIEEAATRLHLDMKFFLPDPSSEGLNYKAFLMTRTADAPLPPGLAEWVTSRALQGKPAVAREHLQAMAAIKFRTGTASSWDKLYRIILDDDADGRPATAEEHSALAEGDALGAKPLSAPRKTGDEIPRPRALSGTTRTKSPRAGRR